MQTQYLSEKFSFFGSWKGREIFLHKFFVVVWSASYPSLGSHSADLSSCQALREQTCTHTLSFSPPHIHAYMYTHTHTLPLSHTHIQIIHTYSFVVCIREGQWVCIDHFKSSLSVFSSFSCRTWRAIPLHNRKLAIAKLRNPIHKKMHNVLWISFYLNNTKNFQVFSICLDKGWPGYHLPYP